MLGDFDKLVEQRSELKRWWQLSQTVCGWGGRNHVLRVDLQKPTMLAYCGQAYAGAKNYHDAPGFFAEAVKKEMDAQSKAIANVAYEKEIERLDGLIEKHRAAVLSQLASV